MRCPREVIVELEARPGPWHIGPRFTPLDGWMYNGDVPGPAIDGSVGDTLVVRLANRLRVPTSLRWSGPARPRPVELHATIEPDAAVEYRFTLTHAGTAWYHAGTHMQLERGLYGALIVRGGGEPGADTERVVILDDVCIGRGGRISSGAEDGCAGDVLLLNGRVQPRLALRAGTVERWRVINVAHGRTVRFSLGNTTFRVITQRSGIITAAHATLAPGTAADLLVGPFAAGTLLHVQSRPDGRDGTRRLAPVFGTVRVIA